MQALTVRQRGFVVAMLELGNTNYQRAAMLAGYSMDNKKAAAVTGHRLAHDDRVQSAIQEEATRRLNASVIMAVSTLVQIAEDPKTQTKDRLKAIEMIANRTGLHATTEHRVQVEHVTTNEETLERLARLSKVLGLEPAKLLGSIGAKIVGDKIIDAEFTEVTDEFAANID